MKVIWRCKFYSWATVILYLIPLPPYLQAKIQKHQAFEAEVAAHSNAIVVLDNTGMEMINQGHFQQSSIRGTVDSRFKKDFGSDQNLS